MERLLAFRRETADIEDVIFQVIGSESRFDCFESRHPAVKDIVITRYVCL